MQKNGHAGSKAVLGTQASNNDCFDSSKITMMWSKTLAEGTHKLQGISWVHRSRFCEWLQDTNVVGPHLLNFYAFLCEEIGSLGLSANDSHARHSNCPAAPHTHMLVQDRNAALLIFAVVLLSTAGPSHRR
jgi:hypothetical protein